MTEVQLKKQMLFGHLLRSEFGTPLLIPNKHMRVGDIGYFLGAQFSRLFNVFDLTEAVATLILTTHLILIYRKHNNAGYLLSNITE